MCKGFLDPLLDLGIAPRFVILRRSPRQIALSYLVPSGSGQAMLSLPILLPVADMAGITRQTSVLAYQFGDGFSNVFAPTSGYFMAGLALIGVSCYDRLELALEARDRGADYVAFGSFYPSITKPEAVRAPLGLLTEARRRLQLPIVAIGGITPENAPVLIAAGADALAVAAGLFRAPDIGAAARRFARLFTAGAP